MLETTSNPYIKAADHSRSGMYLRLANLNVSRPINPKLVLYRGYTRLDVARQNFIIDGP